MLLHPNLPVTSEFHCPGSSRAKTRPRPSTGRCDCNAGARHHWWPQIAQKSQMRGVACDASTHRREIPRSPRSNTDRAGKFAIINRRRYYPRHTNGRTCAEVTEGNR